MNNSTRICFSFIPEQKRTKSREKHGKKWLSVEDIDRKHNSIDTWNFQNRSFEVVQPVSKAQQSKTDSGQSETGPEHADKVAKTGEERRLSGDEMKRRKMGLLFHGSDCFSVEAPTASDDDYECNWLGVSTKMCLSAAPL